MLSTVGEAQTKCVNGKTLVLRGYQRRNMEQTNWKRWNSKISSQLGE